MTDHTEDPTDQTPTATDSAEAPWSIDEMIAGAKTPQTVARICMRADLNAEHAEVIRQLGRLVTADGEVIESGDETLGGNAPKAQTLSARLSELEDEMQASTRTFRFQGLDSEALQAFEKRWEPKGNNASTEDWITYHLRLVAETCTSPDDITLDKLQQLRKKLSSPQMGAIIKKAREASYEGGVNVPLSPSGWRNLAGE